jgi:dihydrofolate reductase
MRISVIAAFSFNRVIGKDGKLPWNLKNDLRFFKEKTQGQAVAMGKNTWLSLPIKPLPARYNIVLTSSDLELPPSVKKVASGPEAILAAMGQQVDELFFIGGERVFEETLRVADRMYLTVVRAIVPGDTYMPLIDFNKWSIVDKQHYDADDKNQFAHTIVVFDRIPLQAAGDSSPPF